jgi:uroporphyrinogen-III synthase
MQKNKALILSTKNISDSLVATASLYDVEIDQISFITTQETNEPAVEKRTREISLESHFVVFTSSNAVTQ